MLFGTHRKPLDTNHRVTNQAEANGKLILNPDLLSEIQSAKGTGARY